MYSNQNIRGTNFAQGLWRFLKSQPSLSSLITINIAVFLGIQIINLVLYLGNVSPFQQTTSIPLASWWLGVHATLDGIILKPWTIITYAFTHEGLLHILFNIILLYFGSQIFLSFFNSKKLLWTYFLGGISGALFFVLAINAFPRFEAIRDYAVLIGASASTLAIFFAAATHAPRLELNFFLLGRVKLIYIALAFIAIDLISIDDGNPGGHFAHLGGALWGFLSIKAMPYGQALISSLRPLTRKKRKKGPRLYDPDRGRPLTDDEYNQRKREREKRVDAILDKLKEKGYEGLSREEKEFLNSIR